MIGWINKKRTQKGFTLIELVVVIAILGILAALAIPRFTGARGTANAGVVLANLRTIESTVEMVAATQNILTTAVTTEQATAVLGTDSWPEGPGKVKYTVESGVPTATLNEVVVPKDHPGLKVSTDGKTVILEPTVTSTP